MTDLSQAEFRKSSRSTGDISNCVEVAMNLSGIVVVRDSKDPASGTLVVSRAQWRRLTAALR
ncbi:MAG: DUF397 domain-containing protein [Streptosporangiaceae bacterium]